MQWILALAFGAFCTGYMKRHRFAPLKSRKITCVLRVPVCRRAVAGGGSLTRPTPALQVPRELDEAPSCRTRPGLRVRVRPRHPSSLPGDVFVGQRRDARRTRRIAERIARCHGRLPALTGAMRDSELE